jgi:cell division protein FtsB
MATRAHAGRTAAVSRRRPAPRKRRPAARSGASRVKWDRIGRIALVVVLAAVLYSYLNPAIDFVKTYTATTAAKAELHELQHENTRLHKAVQSASDPTVVDRKARAQGMVAEGETPIVVRGLSG